MSFTTVHLNCVEMLLESITSLMGEAGLRTSFMFGPNDDPHASQNFGAELYFHDRPLVRAALYLRSNGPSFLKTMSIDDVLSLLRRFIMDNYWYLFDETWAKRFDGTYAERVSMETKYQLAHAIAKSNIFAPENELTVYPLAALRVEDNFDWSTFSLVEPEALNGDRLPDGVQERWIAPTQFPPSADWSGKKEQPSSWLFVRSPNVVHADKIRAIILGAVSLAPLHRYRHVFSGRSNFGGRCTISRQGITTKFGDPHMPPIMYDIIVRRVDFPWLEILSQKITSADIKDQRYLKALEYFYRGWFLADPERFPVLCMALDAVFGDVSQATQAVIDGVRNLLGTHIPEERLRLLMKLRASVIHGGAPSVYDSSKYAKYYSDYGVDPVRDMDRVVARCLILSVFEGAWVDQVDPNADLLERLRKEGRVAPRAERPSILDR